MSTILLYLLEASVYLLVFALAYRWLFSHLTHFSWMRVCLIGSVLLSLALPLLSAPSWGFTFWGQEATVWQPAFKLFPTSSEAADIITPIDGGVSTGLRWTTILLWLGSILYSIGVFYQAYRLAKNVYTIVQLIKKHPRQWEGSYWKVSVPYEWPAFSFLHYIFLGKYPNQFNSQEEQFIMAHERAHVQQRHTYDRLLLEVVGVFFWFHPMVGYLQQQLQEVQEYLADETIGGRGAHQKQYAHLLLKLATEARPVSLASAFSGKQISRRIVMLSKPRSSSRHKWQFALVLPLAAGLFLLSSCLDEPSPEATMLRGTVASKDGSVHIRQIRWVGNTVYNDAALTAALKLKSGDLYDSLVVNERLNYDPDGSDVSSMYMDRGYLFFNLKVQKQEVGDNLVDLLMEVYEGEIVRIEDIFIHGNQGVSKEKILEEIHLEKGEVFKRFKLIAAQKAIAKMGYFDPEQVEINPIPHPEQGTVDIEFVLTPKQ
uniref:POTRA domain-containing protein n=1 Tax=Roseihalotalea indica TaxID=2867963 RepID=A0AA49GN24_9BACT|nr:POTRA domain-containing protein [Tunicatimonas sp. TK19036]